MIAPIVGAGLPIPSWLGTEAPDGDFAHSVDRATLSAMIEVTPALRRLGRYELVARLASGGMGSVYLGRARGEMGFERLVAIKIIHSHLVEEGNFLARFLREARLAAHIRHPHVVAVLDVGKVDGTPYLVLDYVRGTSLAHLLKEARATRTPPSLAIAVAVAREALDGLHAAHTARDESSRPLGIIHRDISPQNILVSADGVAYVTDFGIAFAKDTALTHSSGLMGKAGYFAPEQLAREPLTLRADIFAMGVVLWELLTLERLFDGIEAQFDMIVRDAPFDPPSKHNPAVPKALDDLVLSMLSRKVEGRPKSAIDAATELVRIVDPAPRSAVADWVLSLVETHLDRVDALARRAEEMPIEMGAMGGTGESTNAPLSRDGSIVRSPSRSAIKWAVAAVGVLIGGAAVLVPALTRLGPTGTTTSPQSASSAAPAQPYIPSAASSTSAAPVDAAMVPSSAVPPVDPTRAPVVAKPAQRHSPPIAKPPSKTTVTEPAAPKPVGPDEERL